MVNKIGGAAIAVAAALAMTGALAGPATATPSGRTCDFSVQLPAVIGMSQPIQSVPTQLSVNCPAAASYSLSVDFVGRDSYNSSTTLGPLHYDEASTAAAFQFTSCNGSDFANNGHYAATLVSANVKDSQGNAIADVRLLASSTVAVNSALIYAASSRRGSAVYINGLLKEYGFYAFGQPPSLGFGCGLSRQAGTVYLQRLLKGSWQTMLARSAAADGTITVGFVQSAVYQYRWVVLGGPAAPAGSSGYPSGLVGSASASTVR